MKHPFHAGLCQRPQRLAKRPEGCARRGCVWLSQLPWVLLREGYTHKAFEMLSGFEKDLEYHTGQMFTRCWITLLNTAGSCAEHSSLATNSPVCTADHGPLGFSAEDSRAFPFGILIQRHGGRNSVQGRQSPLPAPRRPAL